jgi:hypothetical protein
MFSLLVFVSIWQESASNAGRKMQACGGVVQSLSEYIYTI